MQLISTITVGAGGAATMEFPAIPATFDDLALVVSARVTNVGIYEQDLAITFNGNTSNRISRRLFGNTTSNGLSQSRTDLLIGQVVSALNTTPSFSKSNVYIPDYRLATAKSYSSDSSQIAFASGDGNWGNLLGGVWNDTAVISSIQIFPSSGTFVQGTTASLYGIRRFNTTTQPKATGGAISYDAVNQKWVHVFTASGTFTPTQNLTGVEYLVVAGGGGGGYTRFNFNSLSGGGGAGGYRSSVVGLPSGGGASAESTLSLTSGVGQTVVVGAGGVGGVSEGNFGNNGSDSSFGSITALGGGGGAATASSFPGNQRNGLAGGSGGGAVGGPSAVGGAGTTGQGFPGGNSVEWANGAGGGGGAGGAGQAGVNSGSGGAGLGGVGLSSTITGTAITRATGGRGDGETTGAPNTGDGAGGGNVNAGIVRNGGSGIVIVRYS